ncbi:MAG: biotin/lipoyl-binding carrier protein [Gammaproteobacteria bacterium]|jgi:acetyl-CoA carboxylase biotin carboxyl carrier protein|nr:biotin/lipoyl-binding carrier protein [Gammaproteobacteria bacterium]|tara:strand:- start:144 stop:365 length:222 start_codon:yes stop_codon:yes gene_type:complete
MARIELISEITGKVWKIEANLGDRLEEGDTVVILESMKMEIPVQTSSAGVVTEIFFAVGATVAEGETVAALET